MTDFTELITLQNPDADPVTAELAGGSVEVGPDGQQFVTDATAHARELPDGSKLWIAPIQSVTPYVQDLRQLHGLYRRWADDPDQALFVLDVIEGDGVVYAAVRYLGLSAAGNRWVISTEDPALRHVAGICESAIRKLPKFLLARMSLARAVLRGLSMVAIRWEKVWCRLTPDTEPREWILPVEATEVDKRRLRLFRVPNRRDLAYWGIYDPGADGYVILEDREVNPSVPAGFARQDFVWYYAEMSERSAGFGEGLGDQLYEDVGTKQRVKQYRARLAERWAEPTFIAKINTSIGAITEATMGDAFLSPYVRSERMSDMIEKWRARHSITVPVGDELDIHEHGAGAAGAHEDFMRFLNEEIKTTILMSGLTSESKGGKGGGVDIGGDGAEERQDAFEANVGFHRTGIEEACDDGLVWEFVRRNAATLQAAGYPVPYRGDLKIEFIDKRQQSPEALEKRLNIAKDWGLTVGEAYLRDELGVPQPADGEIVLQPPVEEPAMDPGGFGGGGFGAFSRSHVPAWHRPAGVEQFARNDKLVAAGLAVIAKDTGRVLMLQRSIDEDDEAAGMWEFPGGGIESDETPLEAARREWEEETGNLLPDGDDCEEWDATNGRYKGFVFLVDAEESIDIHGDRDDVTNPDDPDGDSIESLAWFSLDHLKANPAFRRELRADMRKVLAACRRAVPAVEPEQFANDDQPRDADGRYRAAGGSGAAAVVATLQAADQPRDADGKFAPTDSSGVESPELTKPGELDQPTSKSGFDRAKSLGKGMIKLVNTGPEIARSIVNETGASPAVAKAAMILAMIGDFSIPLVPVGSLAVSLIAQIIGLGKVNALKVATVTLIDTLAEIRGKKAKSDAQ